MKLLKKIVPIALGAALLGLTVFAGAAHAADLGSWKSNFPASSTAVVVGSVVSTGNDPVAATEIANELGLQASSSTSITGESVSLGAGEDQIYLTGALNGDIATITDDDLPTVLADGTFEDDAGVTYDYEQNIGVGARTFTFDDSDNDLDNPALIIDVGDDDTGATPLYTLEVTFTDAVDFDDELAGDDSEGQEIELFGQTYTVGTGTDSDTLQLYGSGTQLDLVSATPSGVVTVNGVSYTVEVIGVNEDGDQVTARVTKGTTTETKTVTEGTSKRINGINIFVKDANAFGGSANNWQATVLVGADELYFENGAAVMSTAEMEDIDGTFVTLTGTCDALTYLSVDVAAADDNVDHLLAGESFPDPVFESIKVVYSDIPNGPTITGDTGTDSNTDRKLVEFESVSDETISATFDVKGDTGTIEFANGADLENDDSNDIEIVEGAQITEDEYFFLMSGNTQYLVQATKVDCDDDNTADDDITLHNVFKTGTADDFKFENKDIDDATPIDWTIGGQTYSVTCPAGNTVVITSDDYVVNGNLYVYPYVETISNKDIRVAFTDSLTLAGIDDTTTIELPTGSYATADYAGTIADANNDAAATAVVGTVRYIVDDTGVSGELTIAIDEGQDADTDDPEANPGMLFVEEEDANDANDMNAVIIPTIVDGAYTEIDMNAAADDDDSTIRFTGTSVENQAFDNSDYAGSIDAWGTYLVEDSSDEDQDVAWFTYSGSQMYADVSIAESNAVSSTTGSVAVMDKDVTASMKTSKNLIVIGGSGANTLAAELLGLTFPTYGSADAWQTATGVTDPGMALVKLYSDKWATGKTAMLVAGFTESDTTRAAKALTTPIAGLTGTSKLFTQLDLEQFD